MEHPEYWIVAGFVIMVGSAWIDEISGHRLNMFWLSIIGFCLFFSSCFIYFFK